MSEFLFHYDDDVVGVKRERNDLYEPNKRMRVKLEKTAKPKKSKRTTRGRSQKTSQYKNIFWGSQQEAWMGSVRFKGVIVRSCSRRSDLLAARILNTRCRQKGLTPPNPEVGFLTDTELRTHTQVAKRGRKKKSDSILMSKVKKNQMASRPQKKSLFKNIFWGTQQQAWMGNIRVKGTIVRSCSRASDVQAAKILNSRCREKGITPPNPEVGFLDNSNVKEEKASKNVRGNRYEPALPVSGQLVSERDCNLENYDPLGASMSQKRNEDCFLAQLKLVQKQLERSLYNNVFYSTFDGCWVGRVQHLEVKASTPELAAKLLNTKCRRETLESGLWFPIPNPSAGFLTDVEYAVLTTSLANVLSPRKGNVFVKTEPDLLAHDLPPTLRDDFSKASSFDDLCLQPSVVLTEEDEFSSMNSLMLDLIENKLMPDTINGQKDSSSVGFFSDKLIFDDLPFPSF